MQFITPKTRNEDIVVQNLKDEVLLYDMKIDKAYCLNEICGVIYNHCNGRNTFEDIRRKSQKNIPDEIIWLAIEELSKQNLLVEKHESGISRRSLLQKAALSAVALPVIMGIIAPSSIRAQSVACEPDGTPTGDQTTRFGDFGCFYDEENPPEPPCCSGYASVNFDTCVFVGGGNYVCDCVCGPIVGDDSVIVD